MSSSRLKVIDVAESYSKHGGGVRTYIHQKLACARRRGVDMVIVAPGTEDGEEAVEGGRIVWAKSARSPFDSRYGLFNDERAVHEILDREDPDLIEGSSPWNGGKYVASYHGRARKAFVYHTDPIAVWPQTFFGRRLGFDRVDRLCAPWWRRLRMLTDAYDTTIVSGDWLSRRLRQFGIDRTSVVPFGIDKQRFSPAHRNEALRQRLLVKCGAPPHAKLLNRDQSARSGEARLDDHRRVRQGGAQASARARDLRSRRA